MPRKAKENVEKLNSKESEKKVKKVATKKVTDKAKSTASVKEKKADTVNIPKTVKSKATTKSKSTPKTASVVKAKTIPNRSVTKVASKEKSSIKSKSKVGTKTKLATKSTTKVSAKASPVISTEYYDLPFRYNQTVVRILAQTPNTLFIYWDISDEDKNSYVQKYGESFFEHTRPYLIIANVTKNYTFEVEINDFANSWYLHINDADCEYKVELVRKFVVNSKDYDLKNISYENVQVSVEPYKINDYLYLTSSNELEMPNDHILFDKLGSSVFFRNVKTNIVEEKDISSISFLQKIGKVYNIYDLYKEIYSDELVSDEFGLNLPSSNSSSFK